MKSDYEFEYEYESSTWIVNLSFDVYMARKRYSGVNSGFSFEPDEITILDQHLEDITFYVRVSNPKLYKTISNYAEERATEAMNTGPHWDEDAWKGYD